MARTKTCRRWTDEERQILRECWPVMHEEDVRQRLGGERTIISVRAQASDMGLKKSPERWAGRQDSDIFNQLQLARERISELATTNKILKDRVGELEKQLVNAAYRLLKKS